MKKVNTIFLVIFMMSGMTNIYGAEYYYDDLNRLVCVEYDSGICIQYEYDQAGNIVKVITSGGQDEEIKKPDEGDENEENEDDNNHPSQEQTESNKENTNNQGNKENDSSIDNGMENQNKIKNKVVFTLNQKKLWLNGEEMPIDTSPFISKNNRLMVPIRYIAYALNISQEQIKWNSQLKTATISGEKEITITVGQDYMLVDSKKVMLHEKAVIKEGRTFLPIGDICRALELQYTWDNTLKQLTVY